MEPAVYKKHLGTNNQSVICYVMLSDVLYLLLPLLLLLLQLLLLLPLSEGAEREREHGEVKTDDMF